MQSICISTVWGHTKPRNVKVSTLAVYAEGSIIRSYSENASVHVPAPVVQKFSYASSISTQPSPVVPFAPSETNGQSTTNVTVNSVSSNTRTTVTGHRINLSSNPHASR